jgi:hypothetical protein
MQTHSLPDAIIVTALVAGLLGWLYLKHKERIRRLELVHQERLAAMDKGVPLPELPLDPVRIPRAPNPHAPLVIGIGLTMFSLGGMITLRLVPAAILWGPEFWLAPLPIGLMGIGLMLYYALFGRRTR